MTNTQIDSIAWRKRRLRWIVAISLLISLGSAHWWRSARDLELVSAARQVQPGMSREKVFRLIGRWHQRQASSGSWAVYGNQIAYEISARRWLGLPLTRGALERNFPVHVEFDQLNLVATVRVNGKEISQHAE